MRILTPAALTAVHRCLSGYGINAVHEHTAWPCHASLSQDTAALQMLGHTVVFEVPDIAVFLQQDHGEVRIELVHADVKAHEAWIVRTQAEWIQLEKNFEEDDEFEFTPNEFKFPHLWAKMYRHIPTGGIVQIIWRKKPIYKKIFPRKKSPRVSHHHSAPK